MLVHWTSYITPYKTILEECWEHNESMFYSLRLIGNPEAQDIGVHKINFSPTVPISTIPLWRFTAASTDTATNTQRKF